MRHIDAMKQWLETMEKSLPRLAHYGEQDWLDSKAAITDLRQAIAEAEKENALQSLHAENERLGLYKDAYGKPVIDKSAAIRIATALGWEPKREWVGLTDEEIEAIWYAFHDREMGYAMRFTRAIEDKLRSKNT